MYGFFSLTYCGALTEYLKKKILKITCSFFCLPKINVETVLLILCINLPFYFFLDNLAYPDNQPTPSHSISQLSYSSCGSGSAWGPRGSSSYLPGPDDLEEDDHCQHYPLYQSHLGHCSHTSQESLNSPKPSPQVFNIMHIIILYEILMTLNFFGRWLWDTQKFIFYVFLK